jgi:hypothetical protein
MLANGCLVAGSPRRHTALRGRLHCTPVHIFTGGNGQCRVNATSHFVGSLLLPLTKLIMDVPLFLHCTGPVFSLIILYHIRIAFWRCSICFLAGAHGARAMLPANLFSRGTALCGAGGTPALPERMGICGGVVHGTGGLFLTGWAGLAGWGALPRPEKTSPRFRVSVVSFALLHFK